MALSDAIKAGGAVVTVSGDDGPLQDVLQKAKARIQAFGDGVKAIGGYIATGAAVVGAASASIMAPFLGGAAALADIAPQIANAARQTGMSFEEVQDRAAGARIALEDMPTAIAKMGDWLEAARNPASQAAQQMRELGLSFDELSAMSQAEKFDAIAQAMSNVGDESRRIDLQRAVLGSRGGLGANFSGGTQGMNERAQRNRDLGGFVGNADTNAGLALAKVQKEIAMATRGIWLTLGAVAAPVLTRIGELTLYVVTTVQKWVKENRPLLDIIAKVGVILGGLATGLGIIAGAFGVAGTVIGFVGSGLAVVLPLVLGVGAAFMTALPYIVAVGASVGLAWLAMSAFGVGVGDVIDTIYELIGGFIESVDWLDVLTYGVIALGGILLATFLPALPVIALVGAQIYAVYLAVDWLIDHFEDFKTVAVEVWRRVAMVVSYTWGKMMEFGGWLLSFIPTIAAGWRFLFDGVVSMASTAFNAVRGVVEGAVETISAIIGDLGTAFGAISDMVSMGDWAGAFEIGMLAVQLIFERTKNYLLGVWEDLRFSMLTIWDSVVAAIGAPIITAIAAVANAISSLLTRVQATVNNAIGNANEVIRALPESMRPGLISTISIADGAANIARGITALIPGQRGPRERGEVDFDDENAMQLQLDAAAERAASDAEAMREWNSWSVAGSRRPGGLGSNAEGGTGLSAGSFSSAAIGQLGNSAWIERGAVASEQTAAATQGMREMMENDQGGVRAT